MAASWFAFAFLLFLASSKGLASSDSTIEEEKLTFTVEGKVSISEKLAPLHKNWREYAGILVDGGRYRGFLRRDGHFSITGLPSGTYVVEVTHPSIVFEPCRVDVTSKGKFRARKLNHLQPKTVDKLDYPLNMVGSGQALYFQKREELHIAGMLLNPMVLMMVLPMILIFVMPKLMAAADPQTQKEMQSQLGVLTNPKASMNMDISSWLSGYSDSSESTSDGKKSKKKSARAT